MIKRNQAVFLFLSIILFTTSIFAGDVWQEINDSDLSARPSDRLIVPDAYKTFRLDRAALDAILRKAPMEFTDAARSGEIILVLPMPDGKFQQFRIENSPVMESGLAIKYPDIQTFRGQGIDDPTATVRLDVTVFGFHAIILTPRGTVYIDPYAKGDVENYITYEKTSLRYNDEPFECLTNDPQFNPFTVKEFKLFRNDEPADVTNGATLRTYRLALAADFEYCSFFGTTELQCMSAMTTSMNRVNGVYEKDVAVHMNFVANNNLIVYAPVSTNCGGATCTAGTDPYSNTSPSTLLTENQANLDTRIGSANYDIGHVFTTGGGGVATLNGPCNASTKARAETGLGSPVGDAYDIDFVAHEMGHQFGANHTFNGGVGNCAGGNRSGANAYEPGSGITIMAYAGICGNQDLSDHSIDTFHVRSLEEIVNFITVGGTCSVNTATNNTPPSVTGAGNFNIPKQTPFALTASATDPNADSITYDWQEYDLGPQTSAVPNDDTDGQAKPILRPYLPTVGGTRTFPTLQYILANANVPPATTGPGFLLGERLPTIGRTMTFQVIARDNRANGGGINTATSVLTVSGTSGPFAVTQPNTGLTWGAGAQTVNWNVSGTSGAPISAANVKISYSSDGGNTFPNILIASTPNDGSQGVTIPVGNTTTARIKVEAVGNIFFDVSDVNFTVNGVAAPPRSRADFDGDGKTDLSVFRPSEGNWYELRSTAGFQVFHWGLSGDKLVPGDYDNDGKTDTAIFRPSNTPGTADFYIFNSATSTATIIEWGNTGDIPVVSNYDAHTADDIAVYRPSTGEWFVLKSGGGVLIAPFGALGDVPVAGDFTGDGLADFTRYQASGNHWLVKPSSGGATSDTVFGAAGDILVPADYDNDNVNNFAVYRPSDGTWRIIIGGSTVVSAFGISTDIPVPGDYDGDGSDDIAVYRNGTWYVNRSTSGLLIQNFGLSSDSAIPRAYIP
jgi:hypothetical protein